MGRFYTRPAGLGGRALAQERDWSPVTFFLPVYSAQASKPIGPPPTLPAASLLLLGSRLLGPS